MWASMWAHSKKGFTEDKIMVFPWEEKALKNFTIEESQKLVDDVEKVKAFYARLDGKENKA